MTAPVSKSATSGKIALDAPIFDPAAFRRRSEQADSISRARELGQSVFAGHMFHHQIIDTGIVGNVVKRDDIRVIERGGGPRFLEKSAMASGIAQAAR